MRLELAEDGLFSNGLFVSALGIFADLIEALVDRLHVGQNQLGGDGLDVPDRVDAAGHMVDVSILEAADHLHDGIDLADVAQELVAQAFTGAGSLYQSSDVHEFDGRGDHDAGLGDFLQHPQTFIRHGDDAHVGIDGAERVVRRLRLSGAGDCVEEGGLAHIGQTDDTGLKHNEERRKASSGPAGKGIPRPSLASDGPRGGFQRCEGRREQTLDRLRKGGLE